MIWIENGGHENPIYYLVFRSKIMLNNGLKSEMTLLKMRIDNYYR